MGNDEARAVRLIGILELWAEWMRGYSAQHRLGYPCASIGLSGGGASKSFDEMAGASDLEMCSAVDASIDDLPPVQSAAIYRRYLGVTYRFPRDNYLDSLAAAHESLMESLPRKITLVY